MFERCHVSLVESNAKKVGFLKQVKLVLNLVNLSVCHQRAEILTTAQRDYFDVVTMRAVGKLSQWLEILAVYVKVQGLLMIPKSLSLLAELATINDYAQFKLVLLGVETVTGLNNKAINTVIFRKFAVSPTIFPRS